MLTGKHSVHGKIICTLTTLMAATILVDYALYLIALYITIIHLYLVYLRILHQQHLTDICNVYVATIVRSIIMIALLATKS